MRQRLTAAAGVGLLASPLMACGGEVTFVGGVGGASSATSGNSSTQAGTGGASTVSTGQGAGTTATVGTSVTATSVSVSTSGPGSSTVTTGGGGGTVAWACFEPGFDMPCADITYAESQYGNCTWDEGLEILEWIDGPFVGEGGTCCYEVVTGEYCPVLGRPLVVDEGYLTAPPKRRGDWQASPAAAAGAMPGEAMRGALARAWTQDGLYEHASIASFGRFALELMALGAPAALVAEAHQAALDEVRHAELCFGLASHYGAAPVGPDALALPADLTMRTSLVELACATVAEGCIGETLATLLAQEQLSAAEDAAVRAVLSEIADDEARHAELAWKTVRWAIAEGGDEVREAVAAVFAQAESHLIGVGGVADAEAHGRLDVATADAIQRRAIREVIRPCAAALLQRPTAQRSAHA